MILALYLFLLAVRAALALRHARRGEQHSTQPLTIIQPILSGDPLLASALRDNLAAHPDATFLWMIDEDDRIAQQIATACDGPNLRVVLCPQPRDGENPKLAKLIRALPLVATPRLMVLDDDTVLPRTSRLPSGPLVTGLPVFTARHSIYERLIGGFVNGNAVLTYLPAAELKLQRTINGMIYTVDVARLRALGGFEAAGHELTDDYAVARLFGEGAITQATQPAFVAMTVNSAAHYLRVMRRWMIFAARYFGDNATLSTLFWIALPSLLPLVGVVALNPVPWLVALLVKAIINRLLLWRITGVTSSPLDLWFECAADLLTPLWMLLAFIQPNQLSWRTRKISLHKGAIRYR